MQILPLRWRKLLLTVHVVVSVGLIGTDAVLLLFGIAGVRGADPAVVYPAAQLVVNAVFAPLAVVALASGLAMGLFTKWGVFQHWWVVSKLVLTTVLTGLVLFVLTARVAALVEFGAQLTQLDRLTLVIAPSVSITVLIANVALAFYKPFGRTRWAV